MASALLKPTFAMTIAIWYALIGKLRDYLGIVPKYRTPHPEPPESPRSKQIIVILHFRFKGAFFLFTKNDFLGGIFISRFWNNKDAHCFWKLASNNEKYQVCKYPGCGDPVWTNLKADWQ